MKKITLSLFFIFVIVSSQAQDNIWVLNSSVTFLFAESQDWTPLNRYNLIECDAKGNTLSEYYQHFDGDVNAWVNTNHTCFVYYQDNTLATISKKKWLINKHRWSVETSRSEFDNNGNEKLNYSWYWDSFYGFDNKKNKQISIYDDNDNISEVLYLEQTTLQTEWVVISSDIYQYDTNNNRVESTSTLWNEEHKELEKFSQKKYRYDLDKLSSEKRYRWDEITNTWILTREKTYTYDANQYLEEEVLRIRVGNEIVNSFRQTYTNNDGGDTIVQLQEKWNVNINDWQKDKKYFRIYNNGQKVLQIRNRFDESLNGFVNTSKVEFEFNTDGQQLSIIFSLWDLDVEAWIQVEQHASGYNENGQETISVQSHDWDTSTNTWVHNFIVERSYDENDNLLTKVGFSEDDGLKSYIDSTHYNWMALEQFKGEVINSDLITLYPNPTADYFHINFDVNLSDALLKIYSSTGELIQSERLDCTREYDISSLNQGVYFVRIEEGEEVFGKKIIIQR